MHKISLFHIFNVYIPHSIYSTRIVRYTYLSDGSLFCGNKGLGSPSNAFNVNANDSVNDFIQ
jgi:hypothetical protein